MLMVIFGAGASYDSCSSFPPQNWPRDGTAWHRPPLAKELFLNLKRFREISKRYPKCQDLFPDLEACDNIEAELEQLTRKADGNPRGKQELASVRYYIRDVIAECQEHWIELTDGVSNYKTLVNELRACGPVCFVTFNYDTLIEEALRSHYVPIKSMRDYISDTRYKLLKLHGSIGWSNLVEILDPERALIPRTDLSPTELIDFAPTTRPSAIFVTDGETTGVVSRQRLYPVPALAIPTISKSGFVCPKEHIDVLREILPSITKILVIGWRAAEQHFLQLLREHLTGSVRGVVVCGDSQESHKTAVKLAQEGIRGDFVAHGGGFTDFIRGRAVRGFLSESIEGA
jgi:SIR2-like domain